jgi:hypothetical protein
MANACVFHRRSRTHLTAGIVVLFALLPLTGSVAFIPYLQSVYYLLLAFSLIMLFTKRKQTLQDILGRTRMILVRAEGKTYNQVVDSSPTS